VNIRTYQLGDEAAQAAVYNEAAADLPKFKPATPDEIARRCRAPDFDPGTRFYAEDGGQVVGYVTFLPGGRVGYPWCRRGHESAAGPLFAHTLKAMRQRGLREAFAAYRGDWTRVKEFFLSNGFELTREVLNFLLDPADMPTRPGRRANPLTPLRREDVPAIFEMSAGVVRSRSPEELERHLFQNPFFTPEALFVLRNRADDAPLAIGVLIANLTYGDPAQVDAHMPCFRLGAFGSEGQTAKRLNGLFSFLTREKGNVSPMALDLLGHASFQFEDAGGGAGSLAAQVPSDAPHLVSFYQSYFRRQGSFPILERAL
jgi:hypothetical protein